MTAESIPFYALVSDLDADYCTRHTEFKPGSGVPSSVSDNGHGIEKKNQNLIFEPFFTTKAIGKGSGLGLATACGMVKQNSGFVHVYSEPGLGTTFRIYLPGAMQMNGKALKNHRQNIKPGTKILFMSGYTPNVIVHRGVLEEGVHFFQEPFSIETLSAMVRRKLDQALKNAHNNNHALAAPRSALPRRAAEQKRMVHRL